MPHRRPEATGRTHQLELLVDLGRQALAGTPLDELLPRALESAASTLEAPLARAIKITEGKPTVRAVIGFGDAYEAAQQEVAGSEQVSFVIEAGEPVVISDLRNETRFVPDEPLLAAGALSGVTVAIAVGDRPWGIVGFYDIKPRDFTKQAGLFVSELATILAAAVNREHTDALLRESEARARAVLDTTVDAIITIDVRGRIESFNRAAESIFGYRADEVIGRNVAVLMPEPYHSEHDDYLRSYRETGRRKIIGIGREVTGRRKDGSTFPMDLAVSEVDLGGRTVFTGVVRDISERRRLEQEVLRISDDERRRIGHDLHDGLGQQLTGIGLILRSLARRLGSESHPEAETVDDVVRLVKEADEQARRLARGLVPVELGADGLSAALRHLASNVEELFSIACSLTLQIDDHSRIRNPEVATHLYRIAQEAVNNAMRHGQARHIDIILTTTRERLRLWIHDDGTGIPDEVIDGTAPPYEGMGLRIMHYRARIIGGSLDVRQAVDGGTTVVFTSPPSSDSPPHRGEALTFSAQTT